jgi:hypothetical protein
MARISIDNGRTTVDVAELSARRVSDTLKVFAHHNPHISEQIHGLTDDEREHLARCCDLYEREYGEPYVVG